MVVTDIVVEVAESTFHADCSSTALLSSTMHGILSSRLTGTIFFFFEAINSDNIYLRACLFTFSNKMWREKCVERETRHIPSMNFQMQVSFFQCSKGEKKSCHKLIVSMNCCRNFETDAIWGHHQNSLCRVFAEVLLFGINV